MQSDRTMKQFSHVILDEIHERDIMADIILVIIKEVLPVRPNLKIVLMSATLNANQFASYLGGCPILHIPGFMYPVTKFYLEDVLEMTEYNMTFSPDHVRKSPTLPVEETVLTGELVQKMILDKHLSPSTLSSLLHPVKV